MSQTSSIKLDISLTPEVVREYFDGKAKLEAVKSKNNIDWPSLLQTLINFTKVETKSNDKLFNDVLKECKADNSVLKNKDLKISDFVNIFSSNSPTTNASTIKIIGQSFTPEQIFGKEYANIYTNNSEFKSVIDDIVGMINDYMSKKEISSKDDKSEKKEILSEDNKPNKESGVNINTNLGKIQIKLSEVVDSQEIANDVTKLIESLIKDANSGKSISKEDLFKLLKIDIKDASPELCHLLEQLKNVCGLVSEIDKEVDDKCKESDKCKTEKQECVLEKMAEDNQKAKSDVEEVVKSNEEQPKKSEEINTKEVPDMMKMMGPMMQNMMKGINVDGVEADGDMSKVMEKALESVKDQLKNVEGGDQATEQLSKIMGENGGLGDMMKMMGPMMENMMKGFGQIQQPKKKPSYNEPEDDTVN